MASEKLSKVCLKAMKKAYRLESRDTFDMPFFQSACADSDADSITAALQSLANKGIVTIFYADNIAYATFLHPEADRASRRNRIVSIGKAIVKQLISFIKP